MRVSVRTRLLTAAWIGVALTLGSLGAQQSQAPVFTSRTTRAGVTLTLKVPAKAIVTTVKIIVYDYASDRLASATKIVR